MLEPITTEIPGQPPIELVSYYPQFVSYYPRCEMATKQWFVENAGRDWVYLDCGANIGYYSILFSRLSPEGSIFAFEPTSTIEMLLTNLKHHGVGNVHPVPMALGKSSGQINDKIFRIWSKEPEEAVYPFTTIDDFIKFKGLTRLDCIKIDVDSFDFEVLQGARQTLLDFDPYVMVELNHALAKRHQSVPLALEWLAGIGYETVTYYDYENCLLKRSAAKASLPKNKIELHFRPPIAPDMAASQEMDNAIARGEKLFLQGAAQQALRFFEDLALSHPDDHRIYNNLGVIHHHLGNLKKALFLLGKGRAIRPGDADLILNQATVLAALGHYAKALDICRQAPETGERGQLARLAARLAEQVVKHPPTSPEAFLAPEVPVAKLHKELGFPQPLDYPKAFLKTPLEQWRMEIHDAPIFRYLYRHFKPKRHLEFGTWQGAGTVYCLEECEATVWTLNLPAGEQLPDGRPGYMSTKSYDLDAMPASEWARCIGLREDLSRPSDTFGFIGRFYLEKGLGHRVSQIYCDSTRWEDRHYPDGFFDSVLVDGGHTPDVVVSDTMKALRLVRPGGLVMWHDYCPPVVGIHAAPRGVFQAMTRLSEELERSMRSLFWIYPSWILAGIRQ